MKNILLLCACFWALATPLRAAVAPPADIVVVRIVDDGSSTITVFVTRGEGRSEKVVFAGGGNDKKLEQTGEGYYKLFQQLYQEGYALQSTFSSRSVYTTLLFAKAPINTTK